eukprot:351682-Chlamydomonas_euryale.AAC.1
MQLPASCSNARSCGNTPSCNDAPSFQSTPGHGNSTRAAMYVLLSPLACVRTRAGAGVHAPAS